MSLGLFNCRLIQPTRDQQFFLSAVLPHRCQFGQALFSLLVARPARPRPAGGRRMLLAFPSQKDFAWFSAGAKSRRRQKSSLPPIHPRIFPKIHLTLPIDSAIEPHFKAWTRTYEAPTPTSTTWACSGRWGGQSRSRQITRAAVATTWECTST